MKSKKVRAYEIARRLEMSWSDFEVAAQEAGYAIASPLNTFEAAEAASMEQRLSQAAQVEVEPLPPKVAVERGFVRQGWRQKRRSRREFRANHQVRAQRRHAPVRRQTQQQCRYRR